MNSCKNNPRKIPFKHFWSFPFKIPVVLCFSTIKSTIMKKYPYKKLPVMINDRRWIRFRSFLRDEFKLWFLIKLKYPVTIYAGLVYAMKWLKYNNRSLIHAIFLFIHSSMRMTTIFLIWFSKTYIANCWSTIDITGHPLHSNVDQYGQYSTQSLSPRVATSYSTTCNPDQKGWCEPFTYANVHNSVIKYILIE